MPEERPEDEHPVAMGAAVLAIVACATAPLALGGASLAATVGTAGAGCLALLLRALAPRTLRLGWLALALLAACLVTALQLVPLPPGLLGLLAPSAVELFEASLGPSALWPAWRPTSQDPALTALALARSVGWTAAFVVLADAVSASRRTRRRLLMALATGAAAVAAIGLVHAIFGAHRLFGTVEYVRPPPLLSTFGNANHLAGLLVVGALTALGLAVGGEKDSRRAPWVAAFLLCAGGTFLTASRGGILALLAGCVAFLAIGWGATDREHGTRKPSALRGRPLAIAAIVALPLLAGVAWLAGAKLRSDTAALSAVDVAREAKLVPMAAALQAVRENPWVGLGRGAFETAHPRYLTGASALTFTHVENEPLQALAELGVFAGPALVAVFLAALFGLVRQGRRSWVEAGAAAAAVALSLQNLVDFSLQFAPGLVLLALLACRSQGRKARELPRVAALGLAAACAAVFAGSASYGEPGLEAETSRLTTLAETEAGTVVALLPLAERSLARHPADYLPCEVVATRALAEKGGAKVALGWLNRGLFLNPNAPRLHALTGQALARLGKKSQAVIEYRTAAALGLPTAPEVARRLKDRELLLSAVPDEPTPAVEAVDALVLAKLPEDAMAVGLRTLQSHPGDPGLSERLHFLFRQHGKLAEDLALTTVRRQVAPQDPRAWRWEAEATAASGDPAQASRLLQEAAARFPKDAGIALDQARFALTAGLLPEALAALDRAQTSASGAQNRADTHTLRAKVRLAEGRLSDARDELRLALRLQSERADLKLQLTEVYLGLGKLEEAATELASVPDSDPGKAAVVAKLEAKRKARADVERELRGP